MFLVSDAIVCNLCGSYGTDYADLKIFMKNVFKILLISFEYKYVIYNRKFGNKFFAKGTE